MLPNICVLVYNLSGDPVGFGLSGSDGTYSARGATTPLNGQYKLEFLECTLTPAYLDEWYRDKSTFATALPVRVVAGSDTKKIDADLARGGSISGKVIDGATGQGVPDFCVFVYDAAGTFYSLGVTDGNGAFFAGALRSGNYRVQPHWLHRLGAVRAGVVQGQTRPRLGHPGHRCAGEGHGDRRGQSPSSARSPALCVTRARASRFPCPTAVSASMHTIRHCKGQLPTRLVLDNGQYTLVGLPTGDYKLEFRDCGLHKYLGEWYDNKPDEASADLVHAASRPDDDRHRCLACRRREHQRNRHRRGDRPSAGGDVRERRRRFRRRDHRR